jgi:hypothetical protein
MENANGVTREAIAWCYKLFLGREPASQELADSHLSRPSFDDLRAFFATHPEFQKYLTSLEVRSTAATGEKAGRLDYIMERIRLAPFVEEPFPHIYIENILSEGDFQELIQQPEINLPPMPDDKTLIAELQSRNYDAISFPGTTTDIPSYVAWHANPTQLKHGNQETCEGYGVVMRLKGANPGTILAEANNLFESDRFWSVLASRFGLIGSDVRRDYGLQKYLDGYEISPHPDIRGKALTFMMNINPAKNSESLSYHTHYLKFRPEREYITRYWEENPSADRAWVPWDWCETHSIQTRNNSLVIFSPGNRTLHAVKASYNHLETQRTQFYGNLWYKASQTTWAPDFKALHKLAPTRTMG